MRILIGLVSPIVLGLLALAIVGDLQERNWLMLVVRLVFALVVAMGAVFSLFGAESLAIREGALVWQRGSSQSRRCPLDQLERVEREGNQLRVYARGEERPTIVVGAGLRQEPAAIEWLRERVEAALTAARTGK